MAKGLLFKKDKPTTGLAGVGNPHPDVAIKYQRKECGRIYGPSWRSKDNLWVVSLAVKEGDSFRWARLKKRFESEDDARELLKKNWEKILENFDLYQFED